MPLSIPDEQRRSAQVRFYKLLDADGRVQLIVEQQEAHSVLRLKTVVDVLLSGGGHAQLVLELLSLGGQASELVDPDIKLGPMFVELVAPVHLVATVSLLSTLEMGSREPHSTRSDLHDAARRCLFSAGCPHDLSIPSRR